MQIVITKITVGAIVDCMQIKFTKVVLHVF